MSCDCIDLTDKALEEHNTRLGVSFRWNRTTGACTTTVAIETEVLQKKRGARPRRLLPTFCPFCAKRYVPEEPTS